MELNHLEVCRVLEEKGITHLYHANTTKTACTFIKSGGLLSRGAVEYYNLDQTPQNSDTIDKEYNVWNDIFLDSVDLHIKFSRQNHYGPILFKYSLDILKQDFQMPLWITKNNPIYWVPNQSDQERYMQNLDEFNSMYSYGSFREMITLRNSFVYLPFIPFLKEIIIDDPKLLWKESRENLFDESNRFIKDAMEASVHNYSNVKITRRECTDCYCKSNYKDISGEQMKSKFSI